MRAARTSDPSCRPGAWALLGTPHPFHSKAHQGDSVLPSPRRLGASRGRAMKGSQGINGPPHTQRGTGAVPVPGSTSFSSDSTPAPLSPGPRGRAQQSRPLCKSIRGSKHPEAREECHSLNQELGAAGPPGVRRGTLAFLLPKPPSTSGPARGPSQHAGFNWENGRE